MNLRSVVAIVGLVVLGAVGCGGSVDSRPKKWSFISPVIIQPNCATANCHSALTQQDDLRLDTVSVGFAKIRAIAQPDASGQSRLGGILRGQLTDVRRMPPDVPLSDADIALIEGWGADGAQWDGPGPDPTMANP